MSVSPKAIGALEDPSKISMNHHNARAVIASKICGHAVGWRFRRGSRHIDLSFDAKFRQPV